MDISAIAMQGVQQAEAQLNQAAASVASAGASGDAVQLSASLLALLGAQDQTSLNLNVLQTASEIQQSLLNIMA